MIRAANHGRAAFALRDLIICVAILLTVLFLVVPFLHEARSARLRTETYSKLKQVALAVHTYDDVFRNLPPAFDKDTSAKIPVSIHVHLLPYIEQDPLYKQFLAEQGGGPSRMAIVPTYVAAADASVSGRGEGVQTCAANLRLFSEKGIETKCDASMAPLALVEPGPSFGIKHIAKADGTSNTIAFATKYAMCGEGGSYYAAEPSSQWAAFFGQNAAARSAHAADPTATFQLRPDPNQCLFTPLMAQSFGTLGLSVGLGDGSVRMIRPTISAETWNRAMQPNDGKELASDWNE